MSAIAEKLSRQIPQVNTDLDEIQKRINDTEAKAQKMTAADVRNVIEEIEANSRVSKHGGKILESLGWGVVGCTDTKRGGNNTEAKAQKMATADEIETNSRENKQTHCEAYSECSIIHDEIVSTSF